MSARILLVDDDVGARGAWEVYLLDAGHTVETADDGEAALAAIARRVPDLVLLDVQMPVRDGFSTLAALRAQPALASLPVILLTGLDQTWHKVRGLDLGAEDFLSKSSPPAELLARVNAALRRAARYRDPVAILEGVLGPMHLADLLQTVEAGQRGVRVVLPQLEAELRVRAGSLVLARLGRFEGAQALERALLLQRGRFAVYPDDCAADAAPRLSHLLMAALAHVDEARRTLGELSPGDPLVKLAAIEPGLEPLQKSGLRLAEAAAALEGALLEAVERLRAAVRSGAVVLMDPQGR
ncbi:MAG: response regulator [Myxococcales bacterium]